MSTTELDTVKTEQTSKPQVWRRPHFDVFENEDAFDVKVSLPGVERSGVDVSINGDDLNIIATRSREDASDWHPLRRELPQGDFCLNLRLNVPIKEDKVKAHVENGILNLQLPKADELKPRKINIS
ncbi:MAG: HSP20 family protein [Lentimonas sp.]|jgi:HSP20 family protein